MPGITPKKTREGLKDSNSLEAPAVLGGVTVGCAGTRTLVPSPGELQTCELRRKPHALPTWQPTFPNSPHRQVQWAGSTRPRGFSKGRGPNCPRRSHRNSTGVRQQGEPAARHPPAETRTRGGRDRAGGLVPTRVRAKVAPLPVVRPVSLPPPPTPTLPTVLTHGERPLRPSPILRVRPAVGSERLLVEPGRRHLRCSGPPVPRPTPSEPGRPATSTSSTQLGAGAGASDYCDCAAGHDGLGVHVGIFDAKPHSAC